MAYQIAAVLCAYPCILILGKVTQYEEQVPQIQPKCLAGFWKLEGFKIIISFKIVAEFSLTLLWNVETICNVFLWRVSLWSVHQKDRQEIQ